MAPVMPVHRESRRLHGTSGRAQQQRHADPRLYGGFSTGVLITGTGARAALVRMHSGSSGFQSHGTCAKHAFLVTDPEELEAPCHRIRDCAKRAPRPGGGRYPQGCAELDRAYAGTVCSPCEDTIGGFVRFKAHALRPITRRAFSISEDQRTSADLCRGGVINSGAAERVAAVCHVVRHSSGEYLMGLGAMDSTEPLSCTCWNAWCRLCELRPWKIAISDRRRVAV